MNAQLEILEGEISELLGRSDLANWDKRKRLMIMLREYKALYEEFLAFLRA